LIQKPTWTSTSVPNRRKRIVYFLTGRIRARARPTPPGLGEGPWCSATRASPAARASSGPAGLLWIGAVPRSLRPMLAASVLRSSAAALACGGLVACGGAEGPAKPSIAAASATALATAPSVTPSSPAPSAETAAPSAAPTVPPAPPEAPKPLPVPPSTAVLHIGDSFVHAGFSQALKPKLQAIKARYEVKSEQSSYTVTWAAKMERLVADTQPDLVIINLGANEVANTDPKTHAPAVRRISQAIGGRPCVWVTAPSWRKDTGILNVIRANARPCRVFDSDLLVKERIARQSDKIHPTPDGGAVWAGAFWAWLEAERVYVAPSEKKSPWSLRPAPEAEYAERETVPRNDSAK
jgi:hypothetical protein